MMKKAVLWSLLVLVLAALFMATVGVRMLDRSMNIVVAHPPYQISEQAKNLHNSMVIADWHADSFLWARDLAKRYDYGHVDLKRMQEGNLGLQVFTTVTKSPSGQNYERNEAQARDNITTLAISQRWPIATWRSLAARALHQASRINQLADDVPDHFMVIRNKHDLEQWIRTRQSNPDFVGALIGTEGSHALDGELTNIDALFDAGFRMMSLQHFFDNKLGGSLHGTSQAGLSKFGEKAVKQMQNMNIIVDVSHSSEATVRDVLAISTKPLVVSHTGFKGHCDTARNISDDLMKQIAAGGGLIAVGFWPGAVCGTSAEKIVEAIQYGIRLVGEDRVALGSDFDGTVTTSFDASEMAVLTQTMLDQGMSEAQIRKVMGDNTLSFLIKNLPQ